MNFSQQPASTQWAALKLRGEVIAEVWFKPEGEPFALALRIPRESFDIPGVGHRLTAEGLLKAVGVAAADVESWCHGGSADPGVSDLGRPLAPPPAGFTHLTLAVSLRATPPAVPPEVAPVPEAEDDALKAKWQALEARWNAILAVEASVDMLRMSMESLRAEMEAAASRTLSTEEKLHALGSDVAAWTKAKARLHTALPKARDFIGRATWAAGTPERKQLEEVVNAYLKTRAPYDGMARFAEQLEMLLKDRQVLSSLGVSVQQECKGIAAAVQGALRTLQGNAAAKATKQRGRTS